MHQFRKRICNEGDGLMMEFTLARVVMGFAGILLLASLVSPVTAVLEDRDNSEYQEQIDNIASTVDSFYNSEVEKMTVTMKDLLPNGSELRFRGNVIILTDGDREFISQTSHSIECDKDGYSHNDVVSLTKMNNTVVISVI